MKIKRVITAALNRIGYTIVRSDPARRYQFNGTVSAGAVSQRKSSPLSLRPSRNDPPRACNFLADGASWKSTSAAQKIDEFHRNGIAVISTDPTLAAHWRQTEVFDRDVSNLHSSWDWAGNSVKPYGSVLQTGMPSHELKSGLLALITSSYFEEFFKGVLGCLVSIGNCRLVKSLPHSTLGVGPQSWHEDGCPAGILRGVLYLTDVSESNGPFQYKDKHSQVHTVLGKTGDLLIFDAMRLPHRAMPPTLGARMAIDLVFMPRLPGRNAELIAAGMNHWPADPFSYAIPTDKTAFRSHG
jgi:hypothetical protein